MKNADLHCCKYVRNKSYLKTFEVTANCIHLLISTFFVTAYNARLDFPLGNRNKTKQKLRK